jgi:hypothetical protein
MCSCKCLHFGHLQTHKHMHISPVLLLIKGTCITYTHAHTHARAHTHPHTHAHASVFPHVHTRTHTHNTRAHTCVPIDYHLLEEVRRADDVARRCRPVAPKPQLPPHLAGLVYQAGRRRVRLMLMPPGLCVSVRPLDLFAYSLHVIEVHLRLT